MLYYNAASQLPIHEQPYKSLMLLSTFPASSCIYHSFYVLSLLVYIFLFLLHSRHVRHAFARLKLQILTVLNFNSPACASRVPELPRIPPNVSLVQKIDL